MERTPAGPTLAQRKYVENYLTNGKRRVDAYLKSRPKPTKMLTEKAIKARAHEVHHSVQVQKLLKDANMRAIAEMENKANRGIEAAVEKYAITEEKILSELAKIAFAQSTDVASWGPDGVQIKASSELSEDTRGAIQEVSETRSEKTGNSVKVKLYDKQAALVNLGKAIGMFTEKHEVKAQVLTAVKFVIEK